MPCLPFFGPDRRQTGIACVRGGGKGRRKPCAFCATPHDYLCDGKGCDKPICRQHAVSLRMLNKDFCHGCAVAAVKPCLAAEHAPQLECRGGSPEKSEEGQPLCLVHSIGWTLYLQRGGYDANFVVEKTATEERRRNFGLWVAAHVELINQQLEPLKRLVAKATK
jgi:hypothetical protein